MARIEPTRGNQANRFNISVAIRDPGGSGGTPGVAEDSDLAASVYSNGIVQKEARFNDDSRLDERARERARIVHELHDTLLQGFLGASMVLDQAVQQAPADSSITPLLARALRFVHRAIDEGRAALRGVHAVSPAPRSLEEAISTLLNEVGPSGDRRLRMFVSGSPKALTPLVQEQLFLIGREAVINALRHSEGTAIEVELQYRSDALCMLVRDNGLGINSDALKQQNDFHWGLSGMRERAEKMGARFGISSRAGAGTEVRVAVPFDVVTRPLSAAGVERGSPYDERQLHPSLERRRSPANPGGYCQHHHQPGRHVARCGGR